RPSWTWRHSARDSRRRVHNGVLLRKIAVLGGGGHIAAAAGIGAKVAASLIAGHFLRGGCFAGKISAAASAKVCASLSQVVRGRSPKITAGVRLGGRLSELAAAAKGGWIIA